MSQEILDQRIIFAIKSHRKEFLELMKKVRETVGEDLMMVKVQNEKREVDTDEIEKIQNLLTGVYIATFLAKEHSVSVKQESVLDDFFAEISNIGMNHGTEYADIASNGIH